METVRHTSPSGFRVRVRSASGSAAAEQHVWSVVASWTARGVERVRTRDFTGERYAYGASVLLSFISLVRLLLTSEIKFILCRPRATGLACSCTHRRDVTPRRRPLRLGAGCAARRHIHLSGIS